MKMQFFSPSRKKLELNVHSFERLLVWHFQASRTVSASSCPDLFHPSFAKMPIITFPRLQSAITGNVSLNRIKAAKSSATKAQQDIVVAISGADDIMRIARMAATDKRRAVFLIEAVLKEDFSEVRNQFEELFRTHEILCSLRNYTLLMATVD